VPAGMIAPQVLTAINELAAKLGYLQIDGDWGTSAPPRDVRLPQTVSDVYSGPGVPGAAASTIAPQDATAESQPPAAGGELGSGGPPLSQLLGQQVQEGLHSIWPQIADRSGPHAAESFVAVWIPADPDQPAEHWHVNLKDQSVSFANRAAQNDSDWDIVGSAAAWEQVINGRLNLSVALRTCQLRYCDGDDADSLASDARIGILARLLGITGW
jgi:hypothetical protein